MWQLLDLLRAIPNVELWTIGITIGLTAAMTVIGIANSKPSQKK